MGPQLSDQSLFKAPCIQPSKISEYPYAERFHVNLYIVRNKRRISQAIFRSYSGQTLNSLHTGVLSDIPKGCMNGVFRFSFRQAFGVPGRGFEIERSQSFSPPECLRAPASTISGSKCEKGRGQSLGGGFPVVHPEPAYIHLCSTPLHFHELST